MNNIKGGQGNQETAGWIERRGKGWDEKGMDGGGRKEQVAGSK